ncbi:hypothetical protein JOD54_003131 [Actinokineospora baliensis]|uniref:hypothetical protein n=1 Tax=Actinokineospora baliensis TaxID=547056 RepID=UPI00195A93B2|nr:hypothetical protein [Actinokineospora baliensis]MBM7772927.1 hypothetical protein [Actinokineospora baliensis]
MARLHAIFRAPDWLDLSFSERRVLGRFPVGDETLTSAVHTVLNSVAATNRRRRHAGIRPLLVGRRKTALLALRRVADYKSDRPTMWDAAERAQTILDLDSSSGEDAVKATLHQWSRDGAARLNLVDRSEKAQP